MRSWSSTDANVGALPSSYVRAGAADRLWEIAVAHALVRAHGEDRIEAILAEAFADKDFHPMQAEVA
jgi:hypothetical protein